MKDRKTSDKLCFINFIFKNGCTDSVAVAENHKKLWKEFESEFFRDEKVLSDRILTFNGIDGSVYVDLSTVAKIEISDKDKKAFIFGGHK